MASRWLRPEVRRQIYPSDFSFAIFGSAYYFFHGFDFCLCVLIRRRFALFEGLPAILGRRSCRRDLWVQLGPPYEDMPAGTNETPMLPPAST